jgi:hypothetical protein
VPSLSTMASSPRTPQEVVAAPLREGDRPASRARPVPVSKAVRASLEGQEVVVTRLAQRAGQREGPHMRPRLARTAGADAWEAPRMTYVPAPTLVRDVIYATESRWDTATALLGETQPHRTSGYAPTWSHC